MKKFNYALAARSVFCSENKLKSIDGKLFAAKFNEKVSQEKSPEKDEKKNNE